MTPLSRSWNRPTSTVSLYGTLNVAADPQAIRVEPLGDRVQLGAPPEIDVTVTLENLDTGTQVTLQDSLSEVGGAYSVHNFWTDHPIQPSTSYRVAVKQGGETVTSATTITPANAPALIQTSEFYLPCDSENNTFIVLARNIDRLAAAHVIYPITYDLSGQSPIQTLNQYDHSDTIDESGDRFEIYVNYRPALEELNPEPGPGQPCIRKEYFTHSYVLMAVTAGGPNWPEWRDLPFDQIARPDSLSNVQGGHGFVGGIYSDTLKVPIKDRPPPA